MTSCYQTLVLVLGSYMLQGTPGIYSKALLIRWSYLVTGLDSTLRFFATVSGHHKHNDGRHGLRTLRISSPAKGCDSSAYQNSSDVTAKAEWKGVICLPKLVACTTVRQ
ncbi:hypothetical protein EI94DRAFT_1760670 [Lactarius quietus]|nr:hypothetical protein EI94DRAFT_1760670 [Lactarius quietus]